MPHQDGKKFSCGREAEDREAEPSADPFDRMLDHSKAWLERGEFWAGTDAEQDDADNATHDDELRLGKIYKICAQPSGAS